MSWCVWSVKTFHSVDESCCSSQCGNLTLGGVCTCRQTVGEHLLLWVLISSHSTSQPHFFVCFPFTDTAGGLLLQLNNSLTVFVLWRFVRFCAHSGYSSRSYQVWKTAAAAVGKVTVQQIVFHTDKSSKFANTITLTFAFLLYLRDFFINISVSFPLFFKNLSLRWTKQFVGCFLSIKEVDTAREQEQTQEEAVLKGRKTTVVCITIVCNSWFVICTVLLLMYRHLPTKFKIKKKPCKNQQFEMILLFVLLINAKMIY